MDSQTPRNRSPLTAQGLVSLLTVFAMLCVALALSVTLYDLWLEHQRESWPERTASIQRCVVDHYTRFGSANRTPLFRIRCTISYPVDGSPVKSTIRSRTTGSGTHVERMQQWVASHPAGSTLLVRTEPSAPANAVLTSTDMPDAGPHTPDNLVLLAIAIAAYFLFWSLGQILRRRAPSA